MNFDPNAAKAAPAGTVILFDGYPGLRLSVSKANRSWIYRYKSPVDGKMRQVKIGVWPAMSYVKAAVEWESLKEKRDNGQDPAAAKRRSRLESKEKAEAEREAVRAAKFTVKMMCDLYLENHIKKGRTPKGYDYVKNLFNAHLGGLGAEVVRDVTRAMAFKKITDIVDIRDAPVAAENVRLELAAATSYAKESGILPEDTPNWWREIKEGRILRAKLTSKGKKVSGKHVGRARCFLDEGQLALLIPWLPNFSQAVEDALIIYLWTGARGSEIMQIEGKEIAKEEDGVLWWNCPKEKTKNCKREFATDHRVPLFGRAKEVILRRKALHGEGYLWPSTRSKKSPFMEQESIGNRVRDHQPRNVEVTGYPVLPVTDWTPHDLRRTVRTLLASLGCPKDIAERVLGHLGEGVVGIYDRHTYDEQRREWLAVLSGRLEKLAGR